MKLETMILIAAAGVGGYYLAMRKAKAAVPVPVPPAAKPSAEVVYVERYPDYGWGVPYPYPVWGGGWGGGRGHHHHHRGGRRR